MVGIIAWNYFSNCLSSTAATFQANAGIFGKVYFPRIIIPFSKVLSGLLRFFIQVSLFLSLFSYHSIFSDNNLIQFSTNILILPLLVVQMAILGQGIGLIITSLTTKYKDLSYLVSFGTQLLMYATPIVYPISSVPDNYKSIIQFNPMTSVIEGFRFAFFRQNNLDTGIWLFSIFFTSMIFIIGLILFNKTEKDFIDII